MRSIRIKFDHADRPELKDIRRDFDVANATCGGDCCRGRGWVRDSVINNRFQQGNKAQLESD
jgi:hypothetical protein